MNDTAHPSGEHPPRDKVRGFGHGLLAPAEAAVLEDHLACCDDCCRLLEEAAGDSFVGRLQTACRPAAETQDLDNPVTAEEAPAALAGHPRYRALRRLGRGGMGDVYLAEHRRMGRLVALKVINPALLDHPTALRRFQTEVQAAAKLDHPNIVAAYDADQAGACHFLVMEYVDGQNLADYLAANGPLPVAQACDFIRQAALGLHHAHERGMIHRDIKPHNLMVTPGGQIKVLDFGLARFATEPVAEALPAAPGPVGGSRALLPGVRPLTGSGAVIGTADYIAPEQGRDAHLADGRSDVYGLGCTLYHLLTGQPPFPHGTAAEKVHRHAQVTPPPVRRLRPAVPAAVARIVDRLMAKRPEDRYQTAGEVARQLAAHLPRAKRPRGLRRPWPVLAVAAALAGGMALVFQASGRRTPAGPEAPPPGDPPAASVHAPSPSEPIGEVRKFGGGEGMVGRVHFLPDGARAVSGGDVVTLWDVRTGTKIRSFPGCNWALAVSPDGRHLLADRHLYDVATGQHLRTVEGDLDGELWGAAFSPDGRHAVLGGHRPPGTQGSGLWVVEVATGKLVRRLGQGESVRTVAYSPDGTRIAAGHYDPVQGLPGTIGVYEVETGKKTFPLDLPAPATCVAFSPDGKRLISSGSYTIRVWDLDTGREVQCLKGHTNCVEWVAFTPDGQRLVSAGAAGDSTVRVWDVAGGRELQCFSGHLLGVLGVSVSPDGRHALSGSREGTLRLWRLPNGPMEGDGGRPFAPSRVPLPAGPEFTVPPPQVSHAGDFRRWQIHKIAPVHRIVVAPDGQSAWSIGDDLRRWDLATGRTRERAVTPNWVEDLLLTPDGRHLLTTDGWGGTFRLRDVANLKEVRTLPNGLPRVWQAAFFPEGRKVMTGCEDGIARIWDVASGRCLHKFQAHQGRLTCVDVHPDGSKLLTASGDDTHVTVWDEATGKAAFTLAEQTGTNGSARFVLGGKAVLTCGRDRCIRLLSAHNGEELRVFRTPPRVTLWSRLALLQDDRHFVSIGPDGFLRLWNLETGQELHRVHVEDWVACLAVTPDGRWALMGTTTGEIVQYQLPEIPRAPKG